VLRPVRRHLVQLNVGSYRRNSSLCVVCDVVIQFHVVKENRGNEGTCVGVSKWPIRDYSHRTTTDMWLYRAYSGNLYHNGEQATVLPNYTHGDCITCVLDIDSRTLAFGKNGEVICYLITLVYPHVWCSHQFLYCFVSSTNCATLKWC